MLNRYHHDRHNLLEFLLSSGSTRSRSGASIDLAGVDLDSVSPDYVIECVLSGTEFLFSLNPFKALFCILLFFSFNFRTFVSGSEFDPSEATRRYFESLRYPITVKT
jgi:hypothetical protein